MKKKKKLNEDFKFYIFLYIWLTIWCIYNVVLSFVRKEVGFFIAGIWILSYITSVYNFKKLNENNIKWERHKFKGIIILMQWQREYELNNDKEIYLKDTEYQTYNKILKELENIGIED
jgi:hypothetical protein